MIAEFLVIYILLLACIDSLVASVKRNWWPLIVIESVMLFVIGDGLLDIVGRMLGFMIN